MSMNPPTQTGGDKKANWFLIAAGGASILGLIAFLSKNQSGGTTAAGTSINAALGSLQEEQLNTQGQVGQLQQSLGLNPNETLTGHLDANQASTMAGISTLAANQNQGFGDLSSMVQGDVTGLQQQIGGVSQQNFDTQKAQAGGFATLLQYINTILGQQQAGFAGVSQGLQTVNQGVTAVGTQVSGISSQETADVAGINTQLSALSAGQQQEIINQVLSDVHNQINFDAVQAGMNGNVNPATHVSTAVNGTY